MRILLAQNSFYYPSHGGGDKSNRLLMEALAARGHAVTVVSRVERFGEEEHSKLLQDLASRGVHARTTDEGVVRFARNGVEVHTVALQPIVRALFASQIAAYDPDVIITSTDDPGQLLLDLALRAPRARVVHLVRATIAVPFGPDSSAPNAAKTETLRRVDGIVGVSNYVARYVREHGGMDAIHLPISLFEPGPEPALLGRFENRYAAMVNPCAVKGIDIFLELAGRMPEVDFAAVPTWGTTVEDRARLGRLPNVTLIPPVDNIDDLLRVTKVMIVPSVWAEARSRIVPEAMMRGVPVIASDIGGIPEAHLGIEHQIPVNPVAGYRPALDFNLVPIAEVPRQDVGPWQTALARLWKDRDHWEDVSRRSRDAALAYASGVTAAPFAAYLEEVVRKPKRAASTGALSDEKRRLLALRLKQKAAPVAKESPPFDGLEDVRPGKLTLFCLPFAGGGTLAYRSWREPLREIAAVCAVRLPGRESRLNEAPIDSMPVLIEELAPRVLEHARPPFAFFGHSMGAGVAFELTRWLRARGAALPQALIASAARAPQMRLILPPGQELDDAELIEQLRRLEGLPDEVLENADVLRFALPLLRADVRLYRNYVYTPGPPLDVPIFAYGGADDPNVRPEHLEGWREQTTQSFLRREFPGGHFYNQTAGGGLLAALREDLSQLLSFTRA